MIRQRLPKYVHAYKDRHEKLRICFRPPGQLRIALPGPLFSEPFWIAYHKVKEGTPEQPKPIGASSTKAGSFSALIADYYASSLFTALEASTQATYRGQLERFRQKHGDKPVARLEARHLDIILGEETAKSPSMASNLRKRLATLMKCAVKWNYIERNPMLQVDRIKYKTAGIRTWSDVDIAKFRTRWKDDAPQRIAMEIMLYTGLRRSDAVRVGRQHIQGDHIVITTKKSGGIVQLQIPIHPEFRAFLDKINHGHLNFIVTGHGAARSEKGFTNWIIDASRNAGLPDQSSPHGVRKAACRMLAEAGCSALEIMAITGHRDIKEIELYCAPPIRRRGLRMPSPRRVAAYENVAGTEIG
ncbi:tyrosine-type recombinase/integrase [Mesorhizobium sp. KR1-2]|uniref:tyrosine-type recombinase/integrase n=1 Tax=Mesorhizobium sp. KR1-2 TaxID=3156609 RepID=UPI0032B51A87